MIRSILSACLALFVAGAAGAATGFQLGVPNTNVPNDPNVAGMRL